MNLNKEVVKVSNLCKWYKQRNDKLFSREQFNVKAVDGIDFELYEGEVLGVIGESGCGKSTLGKLLVRLEDPSNGDIIINGEQSDALIKRDPKAFRRTVQIVFQNPFDTFTPRHTIGKILCRALEIHKIGDTVEEREKMSIEVLENAGLKPGIDFFNRFPYELSGGQLQRISILRSMLLEPDFLVADEPVSMLDVSVRAEIINMLKDLVKKHNTSIVFISHDIAITRYISNRIAVMYLGRIVEMGESDEVINNPAHPYTQALISNCASIDLDESHDPMKIDGEPPTPVNPGPGCYFADRCPKATEKCFKEYPKYRELGNGHKASCHNI